MAAYLLTTLWLVGPAAESPALARATLVSFALVFLFCLRLSPSLHWEDPLDLGIGPARSLFIRTDNLRAASAEMALVTGAALAAMLAAVLLRDPGALARVRWDTVGLRFAYYLASAGIQAAIFFAFFLPRLRLAAGGANPDRHLLPLPCLLLGLLFGALHAPNAPLMLLTFVAGTVWAGAYGRTPNLFAVAVSQALLGTFAHKLLGLSMRVGPFYGHAEKVLLPHLVPQLSVLKEVLYGP